MDPTFGQISSYCSSYADVALGILEEFARINPSSVRWTMPPAASLANLEINLKSLHPGDTMKFDLTTMVEVELQVPPTFIGPPAKPNPLTLKQQMFRLLERITGVTAEETDDLDY